MKTRTVQRIISGSPPRGGTTVRWSRTRVGPISRMAVCSRLGPVAGAAGEAEFTFFLLSSINWLATSLGKGGLETAMLISPSGRGPPGVGPRRKVVVPGFTSHFSGAWMRRGWMPSWSERQRPFMTSAAVGRRSSIMGSDCSADSSAAGGGGGGGGLSHPIMIPTASAAIHFAVRTMRPPGNRSG
jgi:hypothetical protein